MFFMPFGPGGCAWWAFVCCVWFLGLVLFWFAWLLAVVVGGWVGLCGLVFWTVVLTVALAGCWLVGVLLVLFGEFDPGSGRTLAACLTHASRTVKGPACWFWMSGERVSNT